ncbi:MAG: OmpA family protein [Lewinellaceae bacterium]|nr:OmpA family protein [Lewinellaceae bacterium]
MRKILLYFLIMSATLLAGCKSTQKAPTEETGKTGMNKTEKGAVIGAASGAVVGGVIGNKSKNTVIGAILGAAVGGAAGAVIDHEMDKRAEKIQQELGETATVERVGEGIKLTFDSQLLFEFGKSDLKESNKRDLQKFAETLKQYTDTDLLIVGHTDSRGSDSFNQTLSTQRAGAVADYLAYSGVNRSRLRIQGEGESQPVASNDTDQGRAQNRRVEIAVYANDTLKSQAQKEAGK